MEIKVKHRTNNRNRNYSSSGYNANRDDNRIKQEIIGGIKEAKQSILTRYNSEKKKVEVPKWICILLRMDT